MVQNNGVFLSFSIGIQAQQCLDTDSESEQNLITQLESLFLKNTELSYIAAFVMVGVTVHKQETVPELRHTITQNTQMPNHFSVRAFYHYWTLLFKYFITCGLHSGPALVQEPEVSNRHVSSWKGNQHGLHHNYSSAIVVPKQLETVPMGIADFQENLLY